MLRKPPVKEASAALIMSRREFVAKALGSVGTLLAFKYSPLGQMAAALAGNVVDGPGRQWYIQFSEPAPSGWDMWYWLHNINPDWVDPTDFVGNSYNLQNKRYSQNDAHPTLGGWPLGAAAQLFTQQSFNPLDHMMLLQGIQSNGNHGDITESMNGSTAPYAENISRIVADYLDGHDKTLLGHAGIPSVVPSPNRLTTAPIMTPIEAQGSWQYLTTNSSAGIPQTQSSIVDGLVRSLASNAMPNVKRTSSKNLYQSMIGTFNSSVSLSQTNYADSKSFMLLWRQYVIAYYDSFTWLNAQTTFSNVLQYSYQNAFTAYTYLSDTIDLGTKIDRSTDLNSDTAYLNDPTIIYIKSGNWGSQVASDIITKAWRFAMSEFLITNNLAKVVDLQVSGADSHHSAASGLYSSMFFMGGMSQLLKNLSEKQVPGAPNGTSFLDRTLIAGHSDFVRQPHFTNDVGWGTGHGNIICVPMFGHGVTAGVHGAITLGSDCTLFGTALRGAPGSPLPVDGDGKPSNSGTILQRGHILPTIASIFRATVPLNQVTECDPISKVTNAFKVVA